MLRTTQNWPLAIRLTATVAALATTCLLQLPIEREVPGEPFLPFFLVVIAATLAFGARVGFVGVGLSAFLSILFFEPAGTLMLHHAADLIKIELYAILAACSVVAFSRLGNGLISARDNTDTLKRMDESKSILLRELAHGVANNFAAVAAFVSMKSTAITDTKAKAILDEAIEQIKVMGSVHRRLRGGDHDVSMDSQSFLQDLCDELEASMARGRPLSIECDAISRPLCADQAVALGLIVNELVTNAFKHAFPHGRAGCVRVNFEALGDQLCLCVEDDGTGFDRRSQHGAGMGQDLVRALARQLGGDLEVQSTKNGSSFRLAIPYMNPALPAQAAVPASAFIH